MKGFIRGFLCCAVLALSAVSHAGLVFVGSWDVYDGPGWANSPPNGPLAYTGQEAAAHLFGGNASDYAISTTGNDNNAVNNQAWYDVIGVGGNIFAEDYNKKYLGLYYGPTNGYNCCGQQYALTNAASAYVQDNLSGQNAINYAFRIVNASEPGTLALLGLGILGLSAVRRRKA